MTEELCEILNPYVDQGFFEWYDNEGLFNLLDRLEGFSACEEFKYLPNYEKFASEFFYFMRFTPLIENMIGWSGDDEIYEKLIGALKNLKKYYHSRLKMNPEKTLEDEIVTEDEEVFSDDLNEEEEEESEVEEEDDADDDSEDDDEDPLLALTDVLSNAFESEEGDTVIDSLLDIRDQLKLLNRTMLKIAKGLS